MATRNITRASVEDDDQDTIPGDPAQPALPAISQEDDEELAVVERMRALVRGSPSDRHRLRLYRVPRTGVLELCEEFRPDEFDSNDLTFIRDRWGPGEYELRLFGDRGILTRGRIRIAAPMPGTVAAPSAAAEITSLIDLMREQNRQVLDAMNQRPDSKAQMMEMLQMATLMREAFGQREPAAPAAPAQSQIESMKEIFAMMREAKSAAAELAGESSGEADDSIGGLVRTMAPVLQAAFAGGTATQAQPIDQNNAQTTQPLQPLQIPQSFNNPAPARAESDNMAKPATINPAHLLLLGVIEDLCDMAPTKTPLEGADAMLVKLPDEALAMLDNRYWWEVLSQQFPVVLPHRDWLTKARAEALRLMNEQAEPGEDQE